MRWHFRVWHDTVNGIHTERIFFWNNVRDRTGVMEISPGIHVTRVHAMIEKLVADPELGKRHERLLRFPLERDYTSYEPFTEAD